MIHDKIIDQPTYETDRLTLRPLQGSDTGLIDMHAGDARVARMTARVPHPYPPGAAEAFVTAALADTRGKDIWALDATKAGLSELVGVVALEPMDRNQSEIGYWIAPSVWNLGLAREAVGVLTRHNPQACDTIFGSVFQDNPASARVLTHVGFDYIGDAESFCVARQALVPTWTYILNLKSKAA